MVVKVRERGNSLPLPGVWPDSSKHQTQIEATAPSRTCRISIFETANSSSKSSWTSTASGRGHPQPKCGARDSHWTPLRRTSRFAPGTVLLDVSISEGMFGTLCGLCWHLHKLLGALSEIKFHLCTTLEAQVAPATEGVALLLCLVFDIGGALTVHGGSGERHRCQGGGLCGLRGREARPGLCG